ncbi:MAG TPA: flagellin [Gemmatimonadales bacterium]|nr:flagellin [Gemmatimonadales bacterium]
MRISDSQRFAVAARQLATQQRALVRASEQMSSGQRWNSISEDPVGGREVLGIDAALRASAQTRRTIGRSGERLAAEENLLQQMSDILSRAKELATAQGGANGSAMTRAATAAEVSQLRSQLIDLGNTRVAGEYLFGGLETGAPPFQADGSYIGTALSREQSFGALQNKRVIHSGQELLIDTGALQALADLEAALLADDGEAIRQQITVLDTAFDQGQALLAEVGARDLDLQRMTATLDSADDSMTTRRAELAEIPIEEAMMNLTTIQTALQAAYLATSRIQSLSLTEYLR